MGSDGETLVTKLKKKNESCVRRFRYPWDCKTESKTAPDEAVDEGMKTMFGCSLAAVMGIMLMLGLCNRGAIHVDPGYWKTNPRLELPVLDNKSHSHREAVIHVSLNRSREWIFEARKVADTDLENIISAQVSRYQAIGYRPSIRVRIAAHESARHFIRLHRAATSAGIEDFLIAYYSAGDR